MVSFPSSFVLASLAPGAWWAYGSALIVLVGVVGETIAELTTWIKPELRARKLAKASALVLIIGLTGDVISIRVTQLETARLSQLAGDAKTSADKAADAADRAKLAATQVQTELATATAELHSNEITLEEERQKSARFQKEANEARLALAKEIEGVAARLDPRADFAFRFLYALKYAPKAKAIIRYKTILPEELMNDPEAPFFLAVTIRRLLVCCPLNN